MRCFQMYEDGRVKWENKVKDLGGGWYECGKVAHRASVRGICKPWAGAWTEYHVWQEAEAGSRVGLGDVAWREAGKRAGLNLPVVFQWLPSILLAGALATVWLWRML